MIDVREARVSTVTIRVPADVHERLRSLSENEHRPIGEVVAAAIHQYEEEAFWRECNVAYAAMRADPIASAEFDAETAEFDGTLLDGLEDLPWDE